MSNATKCDRCGACYEYGGKTIRKGWGTWATEYDLCPDCSTAFDAWIECQLVTGAPERVTNDGEMLHDTREQLEADVRKHYAYSTTTLMYPPLANKTTDMLSALPVDTVIGWLDRQAAITEREFFETACQGCERLGGDDDDTLGELKAERDELAQRIQTLELEITKRDKGIERLKRRRGELTEQLGAMADRMAKDGR